MSFLDGRGSELVLEAYRRREARRLVAGVSVPHAERDESFEAFIRRQNPGLLAYEHVPRLARVGERIVSGELSRVMVLLPPRYFKSEVFSRLLTAYYLTRFPLRWAAVASYGSDLAWSLSEEARTYFTRDGGRIRPESSAKKRWRTLTGGGMWAQGVGGPMIGFGYHLGIVDDPTDPEKAHSPLYQRSFEHWWPGKWLSRQEPGAAIVICMQRLGPQDPIDFLLRREIGQETDEAPERWHVVLCDEIKSDEKLGDWDGPRGLPPTCTLEPDERAVGEVLAPSRFSPEQVAKMQIGAAPYIRDTQRQMRPAPPSGDFWQDGWFINEYDELPPDAYAGGWDWDLAYTDKEANSASAAIRSFRGPGASDRFPIYIDDVWWDWLEFPELVAEMRARPGPHAIEAKASGKSAAQTLRRERIPVTEVTVDGSKFTRATAAQPVVSSGRIYVKRSVRRRLLQGDRQGLLRVKAELLLRDDGDLDVNDAFVQAVMRHTRRPNPHAVVW